MKGLVSTIYVRPHDLVAQGYSDAAIAAKHETGDLSAVRQELQQIYSTLGVTVSGEADPRVKAVLAYLEQSRSR